MSWLTPDVLKYGAGGLVALVVVLVLTGRLIPRGWVKAQIDQANQTASLWQQAHADETRRADVAASQSAQLLAQMGTLEAFIRSVLGELKGP